MLTLSYAYWQLPQREPETGIETGQQVCTIKVGAAHGERIALAAELR